MKYGFGIDVGGTTVKLAYFDQTGTMLDKWEIPTNTANHGEAILPDIVASVRGYLEKNHVSDADIIGIGIVIPGPVDDYGNAEPCVNLGWPKFNIHQTLSGLSGFPVKAGNDATVAALGECWKGGHNCDNMVFATLGTGVGGGIVIGGNVIHGVHGAAAEIGHLNLEESKTDRCNCGKTGCAELYCSATGIVRLAKRRLEKDNMPSSLRQVESLAAKDIFDAGKAKDALALEVLDTYFDYMGKLFANVCLVVDPEVVVLGGGVSKAGQFLLDGVKKAFLKYSIFGQRQVRFEIATLGNDAGAYGAFRLALTAFGE